MLDGSIKGVESYGTGAVVALLSIVMVFLVLLLIIFLTDIITKLAGKGTVKEEAIPTVSGGATSIPLNVNDDDAIVASLIAAIDLRNETKKNVKVVSIREVK